MRTNVRAATAEKEMGASWMSRRRCRTASCSSIPGRLLAAGLLLGVLAFGPAAAGPLERTRRLPERPGEHVSRPGPGLRLYSWGSEGRPAEELREFRGRRTAGLSALG